MKAILFVLAAAASAQPLYSETPRQSQTNLASHPQPVGSPSRWFGEYDYPAAALPERAEGIVGFSLTVDRTGNVDRCVVRESSGFAVLDNATCAVLGRRAKFKPASVTGASPPVYHGRVRWHAPDPAVGSSGPVLASMMKDDDETLAFASGR